MMELRDRIIRLCDAMGPSGFEDEAASAAAEMLAPFTDEIKRDAMGNLIAIKRCGRPGARKIVLDAHMDEIGFIATGHEDGYIKFSALGGVDPRIMPACEVTFMTDPPVRGVIDTLPPHILSDGDMDKPFDADRLAIDVGFSQEEAEKRIPLGTPAVLSAKCMDLNGQLTGHALDDRACIAVIADVMEKLRDIKPELDVCCLISVQEELGMRGAVTGAFGLEPDYAVAIDVTHAKTPDAPAEKTLVMGKGAAIAVGPNMSRMLTNCLMKLADSSGIPYQTEVISGCSGTDGWPIQISRGGVATAVVSVPLKYMHGTTETIDVRDAQAVSDLLAELIKKAGECGLC